MSKRATQRDVANAAGVSVATVSLALRKDRQIPKATQEKVAKVAAELGYIRHPYYSLLGRARGSGAAMPDTVPVVLLTTATRGFYYEHIPETAKSRGYTVTVEHPKPFLGKAGSRKLRNRGVAAIILGNGWEDFDFEDFVWDYFVVITLDSAGNEIGGHHLHTAVFGPMYDLVQTLHQRGFKRIGAVLGRLPEEHPDDQRRLGAFMAATQTFPVKQRLPIERYTFSGSNYLELYETYVHKHKPDVIIAHNSGSLHAMQDVHPLPGTALVVHTQDISWCAGWRMEDESKVELALDILDRSIRVGAMGIHTHKMIHQCQPSWNEGTSLKVSR